MFSSPRSPDFEPTRACLNAACKKLVLSIGLGLFLIITATAQHIARITQVDTKDFPTIRVYVSVTDEKGNPIPDNLPVELSLSEDGGLVSQQTLSKGWTVSSVLVLDVSGSMKSEDKLQKAKEAALRFLDMAPPEHAVAVVAFANGASTIGSFRDSRNTLRSRIRNLSTGGSTALQDGIGIALDLLRNRSGRKVVVALTDGIENASRRFPTASGRAQLLSRAKTEETSIFTIGLGQDVRAEYLRSYEETKGIYLFSPGPDQLQSIFEKTINLLQAEKVLEYTTSHQDRDGSSLKLSVELKVNNVATVQKTSIIKDGVIPHVRGNHLPYLFILLLLLFAPDLFSKSASFFEVSKFRSRHLERLTPESNCIKKKLKDPNVPQEEEFLFHIGDLVINCPRCARAHYVQSWRMNKCRCMVEPDGKGSYCYQRVYPKWIRTALDFLTDEHVDIDRGRVYLCHCAGDKKGY